VTLTVSPATLQFDSLGHRAGTTAGDDDEISFVIPEVLNDLADVDAYPTDGDVLTWDGENEKWIAQALPEVPYIPENLGDLADVSVSSPSNGDLLQYNSTSGKWEKVSTATQTVVTAVQVDGVLVQIKTRSIKVIAAGDESAWTTIHTGTNCA
jgi:hypothetical protein